MQSLFGSINPLAMTSGQGLQQAINEALMIAAECMPISTPLLRRQTYSGVKELFDRLRVERSNPSGLIIDTKSMGRILFPARDDTEALRFLAADAAVAVQQACPGVMVELKDELRQAYDDDRSAVVRERLDVLRRFTER